MTRTAEDIAAEALAKTKGEASIRWKGPEELRQFLIPIEYIHPDPNNENVHTDAQIERLTISFAEHGQPEALSVRPAKENGHVIVVTGHARLSAADILGWSHLACIPYGGPTNKAEAYRVASNKLQSMSKLDTEKVYETIKRHRDETDGFNPELFGYSKDELDKIETKLTTDADDQEPIDVDEPDDPEPDDDDVNEEHEDPKYPAAAEHVTVEFDDPEQRELFIKWLHALDATFKGLPTRGERIVYYLKNAGNVSPGFDEERLHYVFKFGDKRELAKFAQFMAALKKEFGGGDDHRGDIQRIFAFIDDSIE